MRIRLIWISLLACLVLIVVNEYNLHKLNTPQNDGQLIYTADQPSYVAPALNFQSKGVWKDNSVGYSSYYQRTPGYGIFFYIAQYISQNNAFLILKIIQIALFGCSVYIFGQILLLLKNSYTTTLIYSFLYGILPFFSTFTYFVLSESILPFFILLSTLLYLKFYNSTTTLNGLLLGLVLGMAILVRPQLAFLITPTLFWIIYKLVYKPFSISINKSILLLLLCLTPLLCWNIRNYYVNKEFVGLHPIYHYSNNHMYRPIHREMSNLFRIWESNTEKFHTNMYHLFSDTTTMQREKVLQSVPSDIKKEFKKELFAVFEKYQHASYQLLNQFNRESYLQADAIPLEKEATKQVVELKERIIRQFKFMHYIKTPFQSLRKFVASSHLGLFIYQSTFKGNISMEIVRWLSFSFLFLLLFASFLVLFIPKLNSPIKTLLLGAFAYLFYLIFFQRLNEERYYYVLFPLFFVGSITLLRHLSQRKKRS